MRIFAVIFSMRKGLGPAFFDKTVFVGLDDLPEDMNEMEVKRMAINDAESQLCRSEDYQQYDKNWVYKDIQET